MSSSAESTWMKGQCHCNTVQFAVRSPPQTTNDPVLEYAEDGFRALTSPAQGNEAPRRGWAMSYCYCDDCRVSSGALFQPFICVPKVFLRVGQTGQNIDDAVASGALGVYESTPGRSIRVFCRTCSTPLFFLFASFPRVVEVAPMALEKAVFAQHVQLIGHYNVGDTPNGQGGLVELANWFEEGVEHKSGGMRSQAVDFEATPTSGHVPTLNEVHGGCHCGAVKYRVATPKGGQKFIAGACHCDDCESNSRESSRFTAKLERRSAVDKWGVLVVDSRVSLEPHTTQPRVDARHLRIVGVWSASALCTLLHFNVLVRPGGGR